MTDAIEQKPLLRLRGLEAEGLRVDDLTVRPGECWAVLGETGAGMEALEAILAGNLKLVRSGECVLPKALGLVSFARQQALFEHELRHDDTDFIGRPDPGTSARAFLGDLSGCGELARLLNLDHVLDRGYRCLSSGEARKICILAELGKMAGADARLLVLEHPFDGLDQAACRELDQALRRLNQEGLALLLLCGDPADVPAWCGHLAHLRGGRLLTGEPIGEAADEERGALFRADTADMRRAETPADADAPLVELKNGFARYGEVEVFSGLNLGIRRGEHTLVSGPNGSGKSTLVHLLCGDHPLCYANDLTLFGRRRGSGETIWDVKRHLGIVSNDLHRSHRIGGSALSVILSGLFDSIGLYRRPTAEERALGERWLARLGLSGRAMRSFTRLSYGEQRLILLARALIKGPRLLLLDEPTQGLDAANRRAFLDFLEKIAAENLATILYISHRKDEWRPFFRQHLEFTPGGATPFRFNPSSE